MKKTTRAGVVAVSIALVAAGFLATLPAGAEPETPSGPISFYAGYDIGFENPVQYSWGKGKYMSEEGYEIPGPSDSPNDLSAGSGMQQATFAGTYDPATGNLDARLGYLNPKEWIALHSDPKLTDEHGVIEHTWIVGTFTNDGIDEGKLEQDGTIAFSDTRTFVIDGYTHYHKPDASTDPPTPGLTDSTQHFPQPCAFEPVTLDYTGTYDNETGWFRVRSNVVEGFTLTSESVCLDALSALGIPQHFPTLSLMGEFKLLGEPGLIPPPETTTTTEPACPEEPPAETSTTTASEEPPAESTTVPEEPPEPSTTIPDDCVEPEPTTTVTTEPAPECPEVPESTVADSEAPPEESDTMPVLIPDGCEEPEPTTTLEPATTEPLDDEPATTQPAPSSDAPSTTVAPATVEAQSSGGEGAAPPASPVVATPAYTG